MKTTITLAVAAALTALGLGLATPASADEQGYLDDIYAHGVPALPNRALNTGYMVCSQLHGGATPEQAASRVGFMGGQLVAAAQHQLCPDTL